MKITDSVRDLVASGLRKRNVSKKELAAKLGFNPGWITKFFDGTLKTLTDENVKVIERELGIKFMRLVSKSDNLPGPAVELGKLMESRPELLAIAQSLIALTDPKSTHAIPFMTPKELTKIGAEITRIVAAWDEADDPHYAKIGLESIKVISDIIEAKEKKAK